VFFQKKNNPPGFFFGFFKKRFLWVFEKKQDFVLFSKKTEKNILNCFDSIMQYHYFQNYTIITCYTYYGILN